LTARVFELAISLIGSVEIVAARLGISAEDVLAYGTDSKVAPAPVFDRALTMVLEIQQRRMEDYRDRLARARQSAPLIGEERPRTAPLLPRDENSES
jgi:hypothetical protein